jgi:eukaryotic-like serine/threonine-protein kinase
MLIGKDLGPYNVDKELGSGAMGAVFRAKNRKSGERVAIKLMSLALGSSETAVNRFTREIAILKQLDHPNIVKYKGSGRYHGSPFYIMEYVEGESLDHILYRRGRLPWEEVVEIGISLCAGLQHAHDKGIIHRDLKPSNLMILKDGVVKLTDFGIAKDTDVTALTAANSTVGTAAYMSPEQCRGVRDISHKTDLYSMGIMFFELLTGKKPFAGETAMEVFLQHANKTDYKRPSEIVMEVPIWLNTLVDQLMEKEPGKRPLNAKAVADSLLLIKEKIEAQRSAGVEAATKRRVDKARGDKKLDEEDKDAARAMLGKKKKKKAAPFYTKGWFTVLALLTVALGIGVFVYFAFLRTPSAESLYSEAQTLKASDPKAAREGPIADFLRYHPNDEKIGAVRSWADDIDFDTLDKQMHNRRNSPLKFATTPEEDLFRKALKDEDEGKFKEAADAWAELSKKKTAPGPDMRAWGLIGERYLQQLNGLDAFYQSLQRKVKENAKPGDDREKDALDAVRAEMEKKSAARTKWDELKRSTERSIENHHWHVLAAKRFVELQEPDFKEDKK